MTSQFIHPDVVCEVYLKAHDLASRNPGMSREGIFASARDYVWAIHSADTALFKNKYGLRV